MSDKKIQLKVIESTQDDVNKGVVRMDSVAMKDIGVNPGMIVSIKGERNTVAIVDRALPGDIGLNIIRMDGLTRRNARTSIGELVQISKADIVEAKSVTIAPAKEGIQIRANPEFFQQYLINRAVLKGDLVSLGGASRRRSIGGVEEVINQPFNRLASFGLADLKFVVTDANPKQAVLITENTKVKYSEEVPNMEDLEKEISDISYEDIGGLDGELKKVREMIEVPLKHPEVFETLGIEPPKGVLLHGPPGTGKTLLAKAVAAESDSNFYVINGPEIMGKFYGQSEENLRKIFDEAEKNAPSIIFIDELDAIAPKREESKGEVERRVVAQLLTIMDGLKSRGRVVVMAATNIPNSIDPALRRPGRFDREIEINPPSIEGRKKILKIHTRNMPLQPTYEIEGAKRSLESKISSLKLEIEELKENSEKALIENKNKQITSFEEMLKKISGLNQEDFQTIMSGISQSIISNDQKRDLDNLLLDNILSSFSEITHGFVGADLASFAKESAMVVLRNVLENLNIKDDEPIPQEELAKIRITKEDMFNALKSVRPSAMREVLIEKPNVTYNSIGGLKDVKQELLEAVEWPLKHKYVFKRMGIKPPKGVLLYGPPGTGKTLLAKAIATETEANFISVKGPELLSKWVGESEKGVREIFKKARQVSPAIIFFDEIDAIAQNRVGGIDDKVGARLVNQLLTEMDGMQELNDVIVIAATNRPDMIDTALLRPGRFDRIILAGIPDKKARESIFEVHLKGVPLAKDVDKKLLVEKTDGYVGADIEAVCREAALLELRKDMSAKHVKMDSFEAAMIKVRPSATKEIQASYEEMQAKFSQASGNKFKEEKPSYYG